MRLRAGDHYKRARARISQWFRPRKRFIKPTGRKRHIWSALMTVYMLPNLGGYFFAVVPFTTNKAWCCLRPPYPSSLKKVYPEKWRIKFRTTILVCCDYKLTCFAPSVNFLLHLLAPLPLLMPLLVC